MASLSILALTKSFSFLSIHSSLPWSICLRGISERSLTAKLDFPEKPKKPMSPYLSFISERRQEFRKANPNAKAIEVVKVYSKEWNNLSEDEKQKYKEEYKKKYAVYLEDLKKYFNSLTPSQRSELDQAITEVSVTKERKLINKMRREKIREFNKPKSPINGFARFMATLEKKNKKNCEFWKEASQQWKLLSDEEKKFYQQEFRKEKIVFLQKLQEWEDEMIRKGHLDLVRSKTIKKLLQSP